MAKPRSELSAIFHSICGNNVYFQPCTGTMLSYPCILYKIERMDVRRADNIGYTTYDEYEVTYITSDPDDANRVRIAELPLCSLNRSAISDNLYHYYYRLYF